jgi:hypothetical protein
MRSRIFRAALVAVALLWAAGARAQTAQDKQQAQALQVAGVHLMDQGDNRGAIAKFEEAFHLFPSPKILFNLGRAHFALHDEVEALTDFERFLDESPYAPKESRNEAQRVIDQLRPRLSYLDLEVEDTGGRIAIDGREVGTAPLARPVVVTPGAHELRVEKIGMQSSIQTVSPVPGQKLRVVVRLVTTAAPAPAPVLPVAPAPAAALPAGAPQPEPVVAPGPAAAVPSPSSGSSWHPTATWISAGAAVLLLGGGITAQILSSSKNADFNAVASGGHPQCTTVAPNDGGGECASLLDAAQTRHTLAIVGFVGAGVAAAAAATFYFTGANGGSGRDVAAACLPTSQTPGVSCALSLKF